MPDPIWTNQYSFSQTPEQNGFTRILYDAPLLTIQTTGPTANRRVEINSDAGSAVFQISNVPSLTTLLGATAEIIAAISGPGNAGIELTFQDRYFGVQVYENRITVAVDDGQGPHEVAAGQSNSGNTTIRVTVSPDFTLRVYRAGVLVDTRALPGTEKPLPRVLFWGEEGGTQIFRTLRYYIGGPVAPG